MASDYWEEKQAGFKQALAAWAILLVLIAALQVVDVVWRDHSLVEPARTANVQP
jgi:hypothetical protein